MLAVTLWCLVTINTQTFESTFEVPLKIKNIPTNYQLISDIPPHIRVKARGKGIDLLSEKWETKKDTISIDFLAHSGQEYFVASDHLDELSKGIKYDLQPLGMIPDSIHLRYVPKDFKFVPLVLDMELDFPLGYRHSGNLRADFTDSVMVVGPKKELAKINSWKTVRYKTPRFKSKSTFRVSLEVRPPLKVKPQMVQVTVDPQLYTETSIEVPIHAINVPPNLSVRFDPHFVRLNLLVLLTHYEEIENSGIQAVVDFNDIDERSIKVIPRILKVPTFAEIQHFEPVLVNYIIIENR